MIVVQLIVSGIAMGCVYALIAFGFVLIYKGTGVVNFAQGEIMMLGGFVAFTCVGLLGLPFYAALFLVPLVMAGFGWVLFRSLLAPIASASPLTTVLATIGVAYVLRSLVTMVPAWGTDTHVIRAPYAGIVRIGGLAISGTDIAIVIATVIVCGIVYLFFTRTMIGIAVQATAQNQVAASCVGIPIARVHAVIWAISAASAGLAAVLIAPITFVHSNMGFIGLKAFPAAVLGGFGNVPGAIAGGLILGVVESFSGFYLPEGVKDVAAYVVVLVVLVVRPVGLFAAHREKKV